MYGAASVDLSLNLQERRDDIDTSQSPENIEGS